MPLHDKEKYLFVDQEQFANGRIHMSADFMGQKTESVGFTLDHMSLLRDDGMVYVDMMLTELRHMIAERRMKLRGDDKPSLRDLQRAISYALADHEREGRIIR